MKFPVIHYTVIFLQVLFILSCNTNKQKEDAPVIADSVATPPKNDFATWDQSPMDMSYFPNGYPLQKMKGMDSTGGPLARIIYSRPHRKNREIFGNSEKSLVQYGKEWRLGANEATEVEFFRDVNIQNKKVSKGRYIMYCIPHPDKWTIVLNNNLYTWGLNMDPGKDVMRTDIPVMKLQPSLEDFTMVFLPATHGADLLMAWDSVKAVLPVSFY